MIHLELFNLEYISYFIPLDVTSTTATATVTSRPDVTSESALLPACVKCIHTKFMFIFVSYSRLIPRTCVTLYVWVYQYFLLDCSAEHSSYWLLKQKAWCGILGNSVQSLENCLWIIFYTDRRTGHQNNYLKLSKSIKCHPYHWTFE